jgi:hypothetical protein
VSMSNDHMSRAKQAVAVVQRGQEWSKPMQQNITASKTVLRSTDEVKLVPPHNNEFALSGLSVHLYYPQLLA